MLGLPLVLHEGRGSVCITAANRKPWDWMALLIGLSCLAPSNQTEQVQHVSQITPLGDSYDFAASLFHKTALRYPG